MSTDSLRSELINDGWDGDCSDDEVDLESVFESLNNEGEEEDGNDFLNLDEISA